MMRERMHSCELDSYLYDTDRSASCRPHLLHNGKSQLHSDPEVLPLVTVLMRSALCLARGGTPCHCTPLPFPDPGAISLSTVFSDLQERFGRQTWAHQWCDSAKQDHAGSITRRHSAVECFRRRRDSVALQVNPDDPALGVTRPVLSPLGPMKGHTRGLSQAHHYISYPITYPAPSSPCFSALSDQSLDSVRWLAYITHTLSLHSLTPWTTDRIQAHHSHNATIPRRLMSLLMAIMLPERHQLMMVQP